MRYGPVRASDTDQYEFAQGEHTHLDEDPHADPPARRKAYIEDLEFLIGTASVGY